MNERTPARSPGGSDAAPALESRPAWRALLEHHARIGALHLRELFAADPERGERLSIEAAGLYLDYSKNRVTDETLNLLAALADDCGVRERTAAMFRGDAINTTEKRAALHVALRAPQGTRIFVDGADVVPEVHAVRDRMVAFAEAVRSGRRTGHSGRRIRNVVTELEADTPPALAHDSSTNALIRRYRRMRAPDALSSGLAAQEATS